MYDVLKNTNIYIILFVLGLSLFVLSKAADKFVNNAILLSEALGLPELIIGATIVSLGTTLPELSASVISALQGNGGFGLGNAVGSIITNTGLILGTGALFGNIPVDKKISKKINILMVVSLLFILSSIPYKIKNNNGLIPQWMGFILILIIPIYVYYLIRQEKKDTSVQDNMKSNKYEGRIVFVIVIIFLSSFTIAISASTLVSSAEIVAERIGIPDIIISSTLVAFGTSVPELSTCISAVRKKHGGLAMGNIIGANILNVLFVIGVSAALTKGGIIVLSSFYSVHFIGLVIILAILRFLAYNKKINEISKKEGLIIIAFYVFYLFANFLITI